MQDIHAFSLDGPNGRKIILDLIIAKNGKGFWNGQVLIIQITLGHFFFFMANLIADDVMTSLIYICFIDTYIFFFRNLIDVCVNVM